MPDQYGRVTGRDWLGLTGAISNIDSMRRGQENLEMQQAKEGRAATLFEQGQEDRTFNDSVDIEANNFIQNFENSGLLVGGVPTRELSETLSQNIEKGNVPARANIIEGQKEKGRGALAHALGVSRGSRILWENQGFQDQMTQGARKRADQSYNDLKNGVATVRDMIRRGNRAEAAHLGAELVTDSLSRLKGRVVGKDKINIIETVNGVDNIVNTLTPEEAVKFFGTYSKEKYTNQFVLDYKTGIELNGEAIPVPIRTPDGKEAYYLKQYTGSRVDFYFYNKDGSPYENPPNDMSSALREGWIPEEGVLERERAAAGEERKVSKEERAAAKTEAAKTGLSWTEKEQYKRASKELEGIQTSLADPLVMSGDPGTQKIRVGELKDLMKGLESRESGLSRQEPASDVTDSRQVTLRRIAQELKTKFSSASPEQLKELLKLKTGAYGEGREAQEMWERIMNELETGGPQMDTGMRQQSGLDTGGREPATDYLDRYQWRRKPRWGHAR